MALRLSHRGRREFSLSSSRLKCSPLRSSSSLQRSALRISSFHKNHAPCQSGSTQSILGPMVPPSRPSLSTPSNENANHEDGHEIARHRSSLLSFDESCCQWRFCLTTPSVFSRGTSPSHRSTPPSVHYPPPSTDLTIADIRSHASDADTPGRPSPPMDFAYHYLDADNKPHTIEVIFQLPFLSLTPGYLAIRLVV